MSESDDQLATKLLCALSAEVLMKAEMFDYLCWVEETHQSEGVPDAEFLFMAKDYKTHWGNAFSEAVASAFAQDAEAFKVWKEQEP